MSDDNFPAQIANQIIRYVAHLGNLEENAGREPADFVIGLAAAFETLCKHMECNPYEVLDNITVISRNPNESANVQA